MRSPEFLMCEELTLPKSAFTIWCGALLIREIIGRVKVFGLGVLDNPYMFGILGL